MSQKQLAWKTYWENSSGDTFDQFYTKNHPVGLSLGKTLRNLDLASKSCMNHLDLGCGNGQHIAWLRNKIPLIMNANVIGVDFAIEGKQIDAKTFLIEENFDTFSALKKKDVKFDSVTSIFAIEYSDFSKSLPNLAKIINNNNDLFLMLHSNTSIITHNSLVTIEFYQKLLSAELQLILSQAKSTSISTKLESYFLARLKNIAESHPNKFNYDIQLVAKKLQPLFNQALFAERERIEHIAGYIESLKHHCERLHQQVDAANRIDELVSQIQRLKGTINKQETLNSEYGEIGVFMHVSL